MVRGADAVVKKQIQCTSCVARLVKNIERLKTAPALRNGSGTPPSNPFNFGLNLLIAAKRIDHARSAVVCAQSVLCHLETGRFSAVARRKLSRSSAAQSAVR